MKEKIQKFKGRKDRFEKEGFCRDGHDGSGIDARAEAGARRDGS